MNAWLSDLLTRSSPAALRGPWRPLGAAELAAAGRDVRDGLLLRLLGDVVVDADTLVDEHVRAAAMALLVPAGTVVVGLGAAWVHAGPDAVPAPVRVRCVGARTASRTDRGGLEVLTSRARRPQGHVVRCGALELTSVERTLRDVGRENPDRARRLELALGGLRDRPRPAPSAARP